MNPRVVEHGDRLLARVEDDHVVCEVDVGTLEATDVTLHCLRDGDFVGVEVVDTPCCAVGTTAVSMVPGGFGALEVTGTKRWK